MAKVSVCIPAYNNEQSLRRLLESVEIQTYRDYEVIITDDSEDDRIAKLTEEKKYIQYFKNQKRLGATANWNEAIGRSHGEYVKIMHHDDWFTDKNSLQAFVDMLEEHPEADIAFSGTVQVEERNSFARHISKDSVRLIEADYRNLYLGNTIGAPSAVIVRRSSKAGGNENIFFKYDESLKWLVDMEYYMCILQNNPRFVYTEKPLISIGIGREQLTEQCRDDNELNAYEYGYIFDKYNLKQEEIYRKKLVEVFAQARKSSKDIKEHGIAGREYKRALAGKLVSKIKWKLTHT
ncbi:MAG: glycosyltransferase family 2 protein [Clostridiales bacterium]|nr:glycosyltransferase family 2 protein [Clostridiales bacterium]